MGTPSLLQSPEPWRCREKSSNPEIARSSAAWGLPDCATISPAVGLDSVSARTAGAGRKAGALSAKPDAAQALASVGGELADSELAGSAACTAAIEKAALCSASNSSMLRFWPLPRLSCIASAAACNATALARGGQAGGNACGRHASAAKCPPMVAGHIAEGSGPLGMACGRCAGSNSWRPKA